MGWAILVDCGRLPPRTDVRLGAIALTCKAPAVVLEGDQKQLAEPQAKRAELERLLKALG